MNSVNKYLRKHGFERFEPKAVLFDMDGVIYDSMPNHARAWHQSMEVENGLVMSEADAYMFEGMRGVETIKVLARQQWQRELSDEESERMYARKSEWFSIYSRTSPAVKMPGVEQLMQQIKAMGMTIGVVTGSGQHSLLDKLTTDFSGLLYREYMVTCFDVSQGKPKPDPYLKGLEKCGGLKPWEAIVVENAPLGVRAAQAAQIFTIAVNTGPLPDERLTNEGADLLFKRMTDLAEQWKQLMASVGT